MRPVCMADQRTAEAGSAKALHVRAAFARVLLFVRSCSLHVLELKNGISARKDAKISSKI